MPEPERSLRFSITIRAPRERVWAELTRTDAPQRFYFDSLLDARIEPNAPLRYTTPDRGRVFIEGQILEVEPGERLVHTFRFTHIEEAPSIVAFELKDGTDGCELSICHAGFSGTRHYRATRKGWPFILRNLKAWIETGKLPLGTRLQYCVTKILFRLIPRTRS